MRTLNKSLWMFISALSLFLLAEACNETKPTAKPQTGANTSSTPVARSSSEVERFTATNVAPAMKLFGTGQNYRGALTKPVTLSLSKGDPSNGWTSPGLSPHYLLLDGSGAFEGLVIQAVENATTLTVYLKRGGEYVAKYSITNPVAINSTEDRSPSDFAKRNSIEGSLWKAQLKFNPNASGTNALALADRVKLEFDGTNVAVAGLELYGALTDTVFAGKIYERNKQEMELNKKSAVELKAKRFDNAIQINEDLLRLNPENPYPYMNLGQIYQGLAEKGEDNDSYQDSLKDSLEKYDAANRSDNPERKDLLIRMSSLARNNMLDPKTALIYDRQILVIIKSENGSPEQAIRAMTGLAGNPQTPKDTRKQIMAEVFSWVKTNEVNPNDGGMAYRLIKYASDLLYDKNYIETVDVLTTVYQKFPDTEFAQNGGMLEGIALANMALGRWQEAIEAWKGYVNKAHKNPYSLAFCYYKTKNLKEAVRYYTYGKWIDAGTAYDSFVQSISEKHKNDIDKPFGLFDELRQKMIIDKKIPPTEDLIIKELISLNQKFLSIYGLIIGE